MKALLIALTVVTAPVDTIPDLSHPWSLQECTQWAMEHNLSVARQEITRENRADEKFTADNAWLPSASASASQNWSFGRGIGGNNTYESGNSASTGFSLGANMNLFDGLATPNRMKLAALNLEAAVADLEKVRNDVRTAVAQAYVQILYNYEIQDVALEQVNIDSLQVVRLEGLLDAGMASAAEVSQQKASLAQSRLTLVQAQNNVRSSLLELAQLLELPGWEGFSVQRPQVSAQPVLLPSPEDIYADALTLRPEVKAEQLRLEGTDYAIRIAKAGWYPSLNLSGGLGTNYYSTFATQHFLQQLGNNFSQYVGLSLNIPIFDKFNTRSQVRSARLGRQSQVIQLRQTQQTLYKEIQQAWNGAAAAQAKLEAAGQAAASAQDAFQLIQAKYENGKATFTEFSEARNRLMKARSDAVQATYEALFQTRLLEFYRGGSLTL